MKFWVNKTAQRFAVARYFADENERDTRHHCGNARTSGWPCGVWCTMLAMLNCPVTRVAPHGGVKAPSASTSSRHAWGCNIRVDDVGRRFSKSRRGAARPVRALFDPDSVDDPLLKQAIKEPVAFFGGMFAGFLGLSVDDKESPLTQWVDATSKSAGRGGEKTEEINAVQGTERNETNVESAVKETAEEEVSQEVSNEVPSDVTETKTKTEV